MIEPQVSSASFDDFDAFREQLHGWDTRPVQLGAGPLHIRWDELRLPEFGLAHLAFDRRIADTSAVDSGRLSFCVSLRRHIWCGLEVPAGSLVVIAPGRDIRSAHVGAFRSLEIVASEGLLHDVGLLDDGIDPRAFAPERCIVRLQPALVARFERLATQLAEHCGTAGRGAASEAWASAVEQHTLGLVARALKEHEGPWARRVPRYTLAAAALQLVEQNRSDRLKVRELADALRVTPRALEYAFHSALGVSPARYLQARALNEVRRDLVADGRDSVTAAALRHGFDHLSRFSGQYQRLFGELPSRTRRAAAERLRDLVPSPGEASSAHPRPGGGR